jgi:hypothetical protein
MKSVIYDWHFSFQNKTFRKNIRFSFLVICFLQHIRKKINFTRRFRSKLDVKYVSQNILYIIIIIIIIIIV